MSENTKIQWCDHTFNPWMGCTKVSPGCANCYAAVSMPVKMRGIKWGKGQPRLRTSVSNWREPVKWNRREEESGSVHHGGQRPRVFCASLADWLDEEVPIEWLADLLKLIHDTPNLDWLLLTKRPANWYARLSAVLACQKATGEMDHGEEFFEWVESWLDCIDMPERGAFPEHVWIGATAENQEMADERIPEVLKIPAKVRFLSCEPLLEGVDLTKNSPNPFGFFEEGIHWVIIGGESGPQAQPCNVEWIRSLVSQCKEAGVPAFVKQMGRDVLSHDTHLASIPGWPLGTMWLARKGEPYPCGVRLKDPKGGDMNEWPADLRIRQFPTIHQLPSTIN